MVNPARSGPGSFLYRRHIGSPQTHVLRQHLTATVKGCGLPSSNEAERGMRLTFTSWGGLWRNRANGSATARRDTAKKIAGRQRIGTLVKLVRPPSAVSHSMCQRIARAPPDRRIRGNASGVVD